METITLLFANRILLNSFVNAANLDQYRFKLQLIQPNEDLNINMLNQQILNCADLAIAVHLYK